MFLTRYDFIILDNITTCNQYNNTDSSIVESKMVFIMYDDCAKDIFNIISILEDKLAIGILLVTKNDELYKEAFKKTQIKRKLRIPVGKIHYNEFIEINNFMKKIQNSTEDVSYYKQHPLKMRYMSLECMPFENLLV